MCDECVEDGRVLPSIESFNKRWSLPKTHYVFFEYFYKAVIGEGTWKRRVMENKRLGSMVAEAYANAMLRNHYMAWLYEFMLASPDAALRTEYNKVAPVANANEEQNEALLQLFCGDLDMLEVSTPSSATSGGDNDVVKSEEPRDQEFELLLDSGLTADACKAARDHDQVILKEIQDQMDLDRELNGDDDSRVACYAKMNAKLVADATTTDRIARKKRKRESTAALRDFTSTTRKSKKGNGKIEGWSKEGKRYLRGMLNNVAQDEQFGVRKKWEDAYLKLCKMVKQSDASGEEDDDNDEADLATMLYVEV